MRFNEKEIKTLAAQHKCEKEGNLYFRERQEGFFRKAEGDLNERPTPSRLPAFFLSPLEDEIVFATI